MEHRKIFAIVSIGLPGAFPEGEIDGTLLVPADASEADIEQLVWGWADDYIEIHWRDARSGRPEHRSSPRSKHNLSQPGQE